MRFSQNQNSVSLHKSFHSHPPIFSPLTELWICLSRKVPFWKEHNYSIINNPLLFCLFNSRQLSLLTKYQVSVVNDMNKTSSLIHLAPSSSPSPVATLTDSHLSCSKLNTLTLLNSERPKLYTILAFLSEIGWTRFYVIQLHLYCRHFLFYLYVSMPILWHIIGLLAGSKASRISMIWN